MTPLTVNNESYAFNTCYRRKWRNPVVPHWHTSFGLYCDAIFQLTLFYLLHSPFHSLWLSRGHPRWRCRDTAGGSWCVCVCARLLRYCVLVEGVIAGGMEGTGVTGGESRVGCVGRGRGGSNRDGNGEQTDAAQTPEGSRSHIFLASSRGTEICESARVHGCRRTQAPAHTHTHTPSNG